MHIPHWKTIRTFGGLWQPTTDIVVINEDEIRKLGRELKICYPKIMKVVGSHELYHRFLSDTTYRLLITELERFENVIMDSKTTDRTRTKEHKYWLLATEIAVFNLLNIWRMILEPLSARMLELDFGDDRGLKPLLRILSSPLLETDAAVRNYRRFAKAFSRKDPLDETYMLLLSCRIVSNIRFYPGNIPAGDFLESPPLTRNPQKRLNRFLYHWQRFDGNFLDFIGKLDSIKGLKEYRVPIPKDPVLREPYIRPPLVLSSPREKPYLRAGPVVGWIEEGNLRLFYDKMSEEVALTLALWALTELKQRALEGAVLSCPFQEMRLCTCTKCFLEEKISRMKSKAESFKKIRVPQEKTRFIPVEIRESYRNGFLYEL